MKVSDIIKEGVLGSLVKGMAKGAGLGDVTLAKRSGRLPSAVTTQTTQTTATTAKKPRSKKDFNVVVDDPKALTVNYQGQTYTQTMSQGKAKWVITKTDKDVAPHWAKVLDTELKKYQDEAGFKPKFSPTQPQQRKPYPRSVDMTIQQGPNTGEVWTFYYDDKTKTWSHPKIGVIDNEKNLNALNKQLAHLRSNWQMSSNFIPDQT